MRKGFTLIEILAVLILLAVIGLIAIPIVSDLVAESKEKAAESHFKGIIRASNTYYQNQKMNNNKPSTVDLTANIIKYEGAAVDKGIVDYDSKGNSIIVAYYNNYCMIKDTDGNINIEKTSIDECDIEEIIYAGSPEECFTFDKSTGTITKYAKTNYNCPTDVKIPYKIDGVAVKHIGQAAFIQPTEQWCYDYNNDYNYNVGVNYVPTDNDGYDECRFDGFIDTRFITSVDFSSARSLETIGAFAFYGYDWDRGMFLNRLTYLTLTDSIKEIGFSAFDGNQITSLVLPNSIEIIGPYAFDENQIITIDFNNATSLKQISGGAFAQNRLTNLTIDNLPNLQSIDGGWWGSFEDNYLQTVTLRNLPNLTNIGKFSDDYGPFNYNNIHTLVLENLPKLTEIGYSAFRYNNISNLIIPNQYINIDCSAFYNNPLDTVIDNYGNYLSCLE